MSSLGIADDNLEPYRGGGGGGHLVVSQFREECLKLNDTSLILVILENHIRVLCEAQVVFDTDFLFELKH